MVAGSLEESRDVETEVVETEGKAVLESCKRVSQYLAVSRFVHIVLANADTAVAVDILVFEATCTPSAAFVKLTLYLGKIDP